jgi:hypothetical protein
MRTLATVAVLLLSATVHARGPNRQHTLKRNAGSPSVVVLDVPADVVGTVATDGRSGNSVTCTRSTTATYLTSAATIATAAINACRVEPDGLLVEPVRTNTCLRSESTDNAAWVLTGAATKTGTDTVAAPDGATTADEVTLTAASSDAVYQSITVLASTTYTMSVWAKTDSGTKTFYLSRTNGASWASATIGGPFTATTTWQRFSKSYSSAGGETTSYMVLGGDDRTTAAPTAGKYYFWGMQHELGAYATSYIPTVAASVQRTADPQPIPIGLPAVMVREAGREAERGENLAVRR